MTQRWTRRSIPLLWLILTLPLIAGDRPARDWNQCPALVTLETTETVYALGDTHGDYKRLVDLLAGGGLLAGHPDSPQQATWSGGRSILVVTGDMIDKWKNSLKVIALMRALAASAASQGGRVIISVGNHEAEFLNDPKGGKTKDFRKELKDAGIKPKDVAGGTDSEGIGAFLLCLPFGERVNDWFFSHAGSTGGRTYLRLNTDIESGFDQSGYAAGVLLGSLGLLEARLKPPWWEKSNDTPIQSIARLLSYADALGVKHIVFGHQPGNYTFNDGSKRKKGTMFAKSGALAVLIDMGMSRGVDNSKGGLLRIEGTGPAETATTVFPDGSKQPLWP